MREPVSWRHLSSIPRRQLVASVLAGLMRFGINRLPFRDEVAPAGKVRRLMGQYASLVIFDDQEPRADGAAGLSLLTPERLAWMRRVSDYTDVAGAVTADRYCTCPSGALANSSPSPQGQFAERLTQQAHRFANGSMKFDFGNCCRERGQKAQLYPEYVCARCEAICAARGIRKSPADVARIHGGDEVRPK